MLFSFRNDHRLELRKSFKFWLAYLPVKTQINEIKWIGFQATFVHIYVNLDQENIFRMMRWMRWHCPPDTEFVP